MTCTNFASYREVLLYTCPTATECGRTNSCWIVSHSSKGLRRLSGLMSIPGSPRSTRTQPVSQVAWHTASTSRQKLRKLSITGCAKGSLWLPTRSVTNQEDQRYVDNGQSLDMFNLRFNRAVFVSVSTYSTRTTNLRRLWMMSPRWKW